MQNASSVQAVNPPKRRRDVWMHSQPKNDSKDEMREHMSSLEIRTRPDKSGITLQPEYRWKTRYNLVILLRESQDDLALDSDTLFLAVNILDRYSSKRVVKRCHRKLLGGVALLVASKYLNRTDTASSFRRGKWLFSEYELQDAIQMEKTVLQTLDYLIGFPSIMGFMQIELLDCQQSKRLHDLVLYICELTLFYPEFVSKPSALLAKTAVEIAKSVLSGSSQHSEATSTSMSHEQQRLHRWIFRRLANPPPLLVSKYTRRQKSSVAVIMEMYRGRNRFSSHSRA